MGRSLVLFRQQFLQLLLGDLLAVLQPGHFEGMSLQLLSQFVPLICGDLIPEFQIEWDKLFILFPDDFLVAGEEVHLIEVPKLVGESLSKQFVVVLRRRDVLREDSFLLQASIHIVLVEPIVGAFVLHDLQNPTSVDLAKVLVMQVLVESRSVLVVSRPPLLLILKQAISIGEDLLSESALPLLMFASNELMMFAEILILNLILILFGLEMHLSPGTAKCVLILLEGGGCGRDDPWFAGVVEHAKGAQHN